MYFEENLFHGWIEHEMVGVRIILKSKLLFLQILFSHKMTLRSVFSVLPLVHNGTVGARKNYILHLGL